MWGALRITIKCVCPSKLHTKWPSLLQKARSSLSPALLITSLVSLPASSLIPFLSVLHNLAAHLAKLCACLASPLLKNRPQNGQDKDHAL